ncbi:MAG: lytic transglycosylase domain-containing protein [Chitinophagales bacterium]
MKQLLKWNQNVQLNVKSFGFLLLFIVLSNIFTYRLMNVSNKAPTAVAEAIAEPSLYLLDQAEKYVYNSNAFEEKVRQVCDDLKIAPEWLMAVMHAESRFDASVSNHKGSGATGLIQWMPATAKDFNITVEKLRNMNHIEQLDFVYKYLDAKRKLHRQYESLTDLYLAILYPRALEEEYCFSLYEQPSAAYKMNSGLDEDKDGRVTVQDIDKFVKRIYPTAYMASLGGEEKANKSFWGGIGR